MPFTSRWRGSILPAPVKNIGELRMALSRREFLVSLGAAGALASIPRAAHAALEEDLLYPPADLSAFAAPVDRGEAAIRVGCAAITWNGKDTQAIEDISALRYAGIQLRANAVDEFPDPHAIRDLLAEHKLAFVALSSGNVDLDPAVRQKQLETHIAHAKYLHEAGGLYLQLIGDGFKGRTSYSAADYKLEGELLTEIAKRASDFGIRTGFHNHMNTIAQAPEGLNAILDAADPKYVELELDTAHYAQGGGDPAAAIRKYGRRLLFLHLKDVKNAATKSGYEFAELGQGRIDWNAVFTALNEVRFRGWGVVELDGERAGTNLTPKQSAEMSLGFLRGKAGVIA
jgi:inosose dehydratase